MSPKTTTGTVLTAVPTTDVTPEQALAALTKALMEAGIDGILGKGQRLNACRIAAGRLHTAVAELVAAREHAAKLESAMGPLVKEALAAIAGTSTLGKPPARTEKVKTEPTTTDGAKTTGTKTEGK